MAPEGDVDGVVWRGGRAGGREGGLEEERVAPEAYVGWRGGREGGRKGVRTRETILPVALANVVGEHRADGAVKVGDGQVDLDSALAIEGGLGLLDQFLGEGGREGGREGYVSGGW